jgi:hypothetical protein
MFKKILFLFWFVLPAQMAFSQCSMCTKTAASLDDKAARGLNSGIIYLAFLPLVMIGFVGFKWYRQHKDA